MTTKNTGSPLLKVFDGKGKNPDRFWYGCGHTPVGPGVIVACDQTVLALWLGNRDSVAALQVINAKYHACVQRRDDPLAEHLLDQVFSGDVDGLELGVAGSDFDLRVWNMLLEIRPGMTVSYSALAQRLGIPKAARAVGSALARNCIGYLIPCHRVIRADGTISRYRWGADVKQALLAWERA